MSEQEPYEPVVHVNGLGQKRYQPRKPSGDRLFIDQSAGYTWDRREKPYRLGFSYYEPYLAPSRRKAIRVAKTLHMKELKNEWTVKGD